jgi:CDP-diacylglycerol pyrophosphatase
MTETPALDLRRALQEKRDLLRRFMLFLQLNKDVTFAERADGTLRVAVVPMDEVADEFLGLDTDQVRLELDRAHAEFMEGSR